MGLASALQTVTEHQSMHQGVKDGGWHMITLSTDRAGGRNVNLFVDGQVQGHVHLKGEQHSGLTCISAQCQALREEDCGCVWLRACHESLPSQLADYTFSLQEGSQGEEAMIMACCQQKHQAV